MTTSMVMEMSLGENGGVKQSVNGGGGGRRRSKGSELTQKKKTPQRGMGVAQLERLRIQERWKKMTEVPSIHPIPIPYGSSSPAFPTSSCSTVSNGAAQFRPAPAFHGIGNGMFHGANLFSSDQVTDPSVISFNSQELSSISNYVKCASDGCSVCHKKKRINGGKKPEICSMNPFGNFWENNAVVEMIDAGKTRRCSRSQGTEVTAVHRNGVGPGGGGLLTEYEFFPGKGGGTENVNVNVNGWDYMRMGMVQGGMIGLRGGEGSCVTGSEESEGSVSANISVDLSLKLSY